MSKITKTLVDNGKRVDFMAHRDFLIDQTGKTFARMDIDHSFIAAGRWNNVWTPVHIDMVQTLKSRLSQVRAPDYCIVDECHHAPAGNYVKVMEAWTDTTFIGLTATPCRLDGKGLDTWFDDIVCGPSVKWLIDSGYLADYVAYAPSSPDLTGLHTRMGDYVAGEVDELMDKAVIIGDMVRAIIVTMPTACVPSISARRSSTASTSLPLSTRPVSLRCIWMAITRHGNGAVRRCKWRKASRFSRMSTCSARV